MDNFDSIYSLKDLSPNKSIKFDSPKVRFITKDEVVIEPSNLKIVIGWKRQTCKVYEISASWSPAKKKWNLAEPILLKEESPDEKLMDSFSTTKQRELYLWRVFMPWKRVSFNDNGEWVVEPEHIKFDESWKLKVHWSPSKSWNSNWSWSTTDYSRR